MGFYCRLGMGIVMRRQDKKLERQQALEVLANAEYGNLATIDGHGRPYATPVSFAVEGKSIYIHCAKEGKKISNIKANCEVCFSAVGRTKLLPGEFSTAYESAIANGRAFIVDDEQEIQRALMLLVEKYAASSMDKAPAYIDGFIDSVAIVRIDMYKLSGKAGKPDEL